MTLGICFIIGERVGLSFQMFFILCLLDRDLVNHILIYCKFVKEIWYYFLNMLDIFSAFPQKINAYIWSWYPAPLWQERETSLEIFQDKSKIAEIFKIRGKILGI